MNDLKERAIRGGFAKICAQGATFALRIGSLMILARLLEPRDFGLVGMVTAVIGVLNLFKDFGLSTATVQSAEISEEQISALFWINILVGVILGVLSFAIAPLIAVFYHEPRLVGITAVLATGFLFNAAGVQHSALLQRDMRFTLLAAIDIGALLVSSIIGVGMALKGFGAWALVGVAVSSPFVSTVCFWLSAKWSPGRPRRRGEIRPMMRFGGLLTLNGLIVYIAYNLDKILLGRYWGAGIIGIYGRAYQLINIPTDNLNSAIGSVAFSTLSRLQHDPDRLKRYFLKGYSLVVMMTLPITFACVLYADDLIFVMLGPKWQGGVPIFRLLAPTILIFAVINPLGWLLYSLGLVGRSLKIALVIAPLVTAGYFIGLPFGPKGVALAYSSAMTLWLFPHVLWSVSGTGISVWDVLLAAGRPAVSGIIAAAVAFSVQFYFGHLLSPVLRLAVGGTVLFGVYFILLVSIMGQRTLFMDLLRGLKKTPSMEATAAVSA